MGDRRSQRIKAYILPQSFTGLRVEMMPEWILVSRHAAFRGLGSFVLLTTRMVGRTNVLMCADFHNPSQDRQSFPGGTPELASICTRRMVEFVNSPGNDDFRRTCIGRMTLYSVVVAFSSRRITVQNGELSILLPSHRRTQDRSNVVVY